MSLLVCDRCNQIVDTLASRKVEVLWTRCATCSDAPPQEILNDD
ncbi:MAG: GapA-binding peptide SR1P [Firmicutes bacterium]|nr:GapA-binding peptide SR1P [Bacillota bacterium]